MAAIAQTTTKVEPAFIPNAGTAEKWEIDPAHTSITFGVRHMMVSTVRGEFQKISGSALWNPAQPEASEIQATIEVASINTREEKRDAHLRSPDFFDVEKYPTIAFRSKSVNRKKDGALEVLGDLTIRDTTHSVTLQVEGPTGTYADPWGGVRIGASARTVIKRSDFGMTWNVLLEAGGMVVGDEIKIELEVELQRKAT